MSTDLAQARDRAQVALDALDCGEGEPAVPDEFRLHNDKPTIPVEGDCYLDDRMVMMFSAGHWHTVGALRDFNEPGLDLTRLQSELARFKRGLWEMP